MENTTTIRLMDGTAITAETSKVTSHTSYLRVVVPGGSNLYPWFNIVKVERREVRA